jgi:hypothetical protein
MFSELNMYIYQHIVTFVKAVDIFINLHFSYCNKHNFMEPDVPYKVSACEKHLDIP